MSEYQIISRATIVRRAQRDHAAGIPLDDCPYHTWTAAYATHKAEYLRLDALARTSPQFHAAPAGQRHLDVAHAGQP